MSERMEPIRVLHILTSLDRGGIETMLMNYYRNIDRDKLQFDFLLHRTGEFEYSEEIRSLGGRIFSVSNYNPLSPNYRKQLDSFFKKHTEYHVVHSHLNCLSALPLKYAKKNGVRIRIAHSHIIINRVSLKNLYKLLARHFIPLYATDFFSCSGDAGTWMFGNRMVTFMPNAIDVMSYRYNMAIRKRIRNSVNVDDETIIIGNVGRLTCQKNQDFLLRIAEKLKLNNVKYKLILIGEGEDRDKLEQSVVQKELSSKVLFIGPVNNVNEYMQGFDIFMFPSLYEGLGIVAIEAQAAGLMTFCSDKVPKEVNVTDNCIFLGLDNIDNWCAEFKKKCGYIRKDNTSRVIQSGYDIHEAAARFQSFYLKKHNLV